MWKSKCNITDCVFFYLFAFQHIKPPFSPLSLFGVHGKFLFLYFDSGQCHVMIMTRPPTYLANYGRKRVSKGMSSFVCCCSFTVHYHVVGGEVTQLYHKTAGHQLSFSSTLHISTVNFVFNFVVWSLALNIIWLLNSLFYCTVITLKLKKVGNQLQGSACSLHSSRHLFKDAFHLGSQKKHIILRILQTNTHMANLGITLTIMSVNLWSVTWVFATSSDYPACKNQRQAEKPHDLTHVIAHPRCYM